ncbi:Membrane protein MosC [Aquirufa nivalisilvae]|uniref:Membrane protein MosC n=1 Tax=Aquirufa nivalisilvae TaxID=2516557 RepID=A0A2S2DV22_9BACT|nr:MFS transporter [Aquirufa nivalisilvae]AWL09238.1 Membrane protein MosC [Aquirufa nivalisilvae]
MPQARLAISVLFLLCGLNFASWATRIPDFKEFLSLSDAELGSILMGLPIGSMVSLPLAGWLIARYNSKIICLLAIVLYILILPALTFISSSLFLFVGLFSFGMAGDILNISMNTQVVSLEKLTNKKTMSSFHAIFSIGLMLGSLLGGYLVKLDVTLNQHFYMIALCNLISIIGVYRYLLIDSKNEEQENNMVEPKFKLNNYLLILSFVAFCGMLCEGAMADWISLYFKLLPNLDGYPFTIGFSSFAFSMVIGRLIGDWAAKHLSIRNILMMNGLLIALGMSITVFFTQVPLLILGCFITGIGISTIVPMIYSQAGNTKDTSPAMAIAAVSTIAYVGFMLGPVVIGFLSEYYGLKQALILLIILGLLASGISKFALNKE